MVIDLLQVLVGLDLLLVLAGLVGQVGLVIFLVLAGRFQAVQQGSWGSLLPPLQRDELSEDKRRERRKQQVGREVDPVAGETEENCPLFGSTWAGWSCEKESC